MFCSLKFCCLIEDSLRKYGIELIMFSLLKFIELFINFGSQNNITICDKLFVSIFFNTFNKVFSYTFWWCTLISFEDGFSTYILHEKIKVKLTIIISKDYNLY